MSDYSDLIGQSYGQQNPALPTTVGNIDEDPDKAQRAIDLSKATGVAPTSIYGDLEEFERQHKAVLASDIVANNPHLSDYVQSNPMAAKISNDDYGQLDTVSSKVTAMQLPKRARAWLDSTTIADNFAEGFGSGRIGDWLSDSDLKDHPIGSAIAAGLGTPIELAFRALSGVAHSGLEELNAGLTAIGSEQLGRDVTGLVEAEAFGMTGRHELHGPTPDPAARIRPYIENGREPLPTILPEYDDFRAKQNKDDVDALKAATSEAQASLTRDRSPEMFRSFIAQHTDAEIGVAGDAVVGLYGDKIPAADDGLLGWVPGIEDKLALARETGTDVAIPLPDWLARAEPEVMQALHDDLRVRPGGITANEVKLASEAKEGLPEGATVPGEGEVIPEDVPSLRAATALEPMFSVGDRPLRLERIKAALNSANERWTPDASGAEADVFFHGDYAVRRLKNEGDVLPARPKTDLVLQPEHIDDATKSEVLPKLSEVGRLKDFDKKEVQQFIIDLGKQGLRVKDDGGINFGKHNGKLVAIDPGAVDELGEINHLHVDPTAKQFGVDLAKELGIKPKSGLGSLFGEKLSVEAQKKLELQRMRQKADSNFTAAQGFHDFNLVNDKGQTIGALNISEAKGGKELYVDNITGVNGLGPRDFGPALMRDLLRQLKAEFPDAESITGHRVSGAREKAGSFMAPSASPVVKLDKLDEAGFQQLLEQNGHWETYSPNLQGYIKPDAMRSAEDRQLIDIVNSELDRIVPKKTAIQGVDSLAVSGQLEGQRAGEAIHAGGAYVRYKETYPIILYALDGENALAAARHEAIHHLRNYGFFKPGEWDTLEAEALAGGWLSKYGIDRRYPTGSPSLKLEEAVAEAYQDWAGKQDTLADRAAQTAQIPSPLDAIFQRMKDFFDGIKQRIGALLGKDPKWDDIFQKVSTGEVGGREGTEPLDARAFNEKLSVPEEFQYKNLPERPANENEKFELPEPLSREERDWENYGKNMSPDDVMNSEIVWAAANRAAEEGHGRAEGFAQYANMLWQRMGANKYISADIARRYMRVEEAKASGIGALDAKLSVQEGPEDGSRVFERAGALGMTVDQFKAYDRLIQKRNAEDVAAAQKRIDDFQRKTQTKEWRDNRRELRKEISDQIHQRPDVAADLFFATGELYGQKISTGYKLDTDQLTPEQRLAIPKDYQARGGLNPDDVANIFGYGSGDAMLQRLAEYNAAKKASGLSAKDFVSRVTDAEADRQMRIKHGVLEDNIVDSVKEQVASETQLDILHEETVALGMKLGQAPLDKGAILAGVRDQFSKVQLGSFSSDRYLATAGKAGKAAELALLKDDPAAAFKEKQRQYYATALANEAMKTERAIAQFEKTAKRFSKREVGTIDQAYTNFIHDILMRVGKPVRRSVQDLEAEIAAGEYKSLGEFVEGKETHGLREVPVADVLLDPGFRKKFEDLTVDEFNATNDSIKTLIKNGRDEKKIVKAGEEADLGEVKAQMIEQLQQFQERSYDAKGGRWMGPIPPAIAKVLRTYGTAHIQIENLFNRWDHDDPKGVFQQYVMRDLADAANNESAMEKRFAARVREVDDKADLKKGVDNTLFKVPGTEQMMKLNRGNLRTVLLNMGNESNMSKLARGYGIKPEQLWQWVNQHATREDWDWAQRMGDVFAEIKSEADVMYRNLSGVAPASLDIKPVQTLHGEYPGWYYPVIYHPEFEGASKKLMGKDALEQEGFIRATTPSGYTKGRTGYAGPMALDLDMLPARMKQMVHDIAMRPAVINASKIMYDKDIRSAVSKHFGNEWRDMLVPYLVDVANSANYMPKQQRIFTGVSEFIRQNMISTLVGLNPGTVLKHGPTAAVQSLHEVGVGNFLKALKGLTSINERTGESNWQFAMRESDELQRRHQNYEETLGGTVNQLMPQNAFMTFRQTVQKFSATPVAISDLLSAVPTWLARYEQSVDEGATHGDAVFDANRAVRRAHGSTAITNRSQVMRGGAMSQWMASVYGFFNHIMNRQYELLWKAGEAMDLAKDGQYQAAMQRAPELTSMLFAYVLAPALIEEMVTPLVSKDDESWGKKAAKGIAYTLGASWVGVRDVASAILNGRDPSVGLFSTAYKTVSDVARNLSKPAPLSKEHAGKIIRDGATLMGSLTGVVPAQAGKVAEFVQRTGTGQERPKGPWGWMVGGRFGTLKNHSGTFQEYMRHH